MAQSSSTTSAGSAVESQLREDRTFPPPPGFSSQAHLQTLEQFHELYQQSIDNPEKFWAEQAADLHWFEKWDRVVEWNAPDAKWFVGGKTNLCYNCVDRQVDNGEGHWPAIIWEGEPIDQATGPELRTLTYQDMQRQTAKFANVLKSLGVRKGDVVTLYMPMIPELAIAMLACARIGAVHSIIFGGFSAQAIKDRVDDGQSRIIITADGGYRRGKPVPLKANCDQAMQMTDRVETCVVVERCGIDIDWEEGRDHWYHQLMEQASDHCPCASLDSEDLSFILYTSGSTGKPKGIMHTTGGYMVYTYLTSKYVFDLHSRDEYGQETDDANASGEGGKGGQAGNGGASQSNESASAGARAGAAGGGGDVYWCTADIGWITGHSYIIYGIMPNRVPTLMYEGAPTHPAPDRFWDIVERHDVTKFYTAPTAIRAFMKAGDEHPNKHDLSSLKLLGTVGEPINPEAWMWYYRVIGGERCPIVDTYWQTETGGHVITPLPGTTTTVPGSCTWPFFGIDAAVVDEQGTERRANEGGILVIRKPWPGMLRGIYGDRQRFIDTYWSKVDPEKGYYVAGDGARRDEAGNFWIMGRIDDVILVAGHNIGTMEVESALVSHERVAEAAVVGYPHEIKGNAIAAFVILRGGQMPEGDQAQALKDELIKHVGNALGAICKPEKIILTDALPKTRSGKIMRRLLRDIAAGREITQDTTTLEDRTIVDRLAAAAGS